MHNLVDSLTNVKGNNGLPSSVTVYHFECESYLIRQASIAAGQKNQTHLVSNIERKLKNTNSLITIDQVLNAIENDSKLKNFLIIASSEMIKEFIESVSSTLIVMSNH